jgi:malate dehydrogenase
LIDDQASIAAGKALDIMQSAPLDGFATAVSGSADFVTAASADVLIIADRAGGEEWRGDEGLLLLNRVQRLGTSPLIVCAAANGRELVERGVREVKLRRQRIIGSAPEALAGAVRAIVAAEIDRSSRDVALTVIGVPPAHMVVPWESATIDGFAATNLLDESARRRLALKIAALWPPGPYAIASAATKAVEAIAGKSRQTLTVFVAPDDSDGRKTRAAALPVRLGLSGIENVELPRLNGRDRVALDNAMLL